MRDSLNIQTTTCHRLDADLCIKIADFGLCRYVGDSNYYRPSTNSELPLRWMPPEIIVDNDEPPRFTLAVDVV